MNFLLTSYWLPINHWTSYWLPIIFLLFSFTSYWLPINLLLASYCILFNQWTSYWLPIIFLLITELPIDFPLTSYWLPIIFLLSMNFLLASYCIPIIQFTSVQLGRGWVPQQGGLWGRGGGWDPSFLPRGHLVGGPPLHFFFTCEEKISIIWGGWSVSLIWRYQVFWGTLWGAPINSLKIAFFI